MVADVGRQAISSRRDSERNVDAHSHLALSVRIRENGARSPEKDVAEPRLRQEVAFEIHDHHLRQQRGVGRDAQELSNPRVPSVRSHQEARSALATVGTPDPYGPSMFEDELRDTSPQLDADMHSAGHFTAQMSDQPQMFEAEPGGGSRGIWQDRGIVVRALEGREPVDVHADACGYCIAEADLG